MSVPAHLSGDFDVTIPLHDVSKYATGDEPARWLIVTGRPRNLRDRGWVYIRTDSQIVGRVVALGTAFLDSRPERTGSPPGVRGPGPVIVVDPATWDLSQVFDLSGDGRFHGQGMRYVRTGADGSLRHWSATEQVDYGDAVYPTPAPGPGPSVEVANRHVTTGDEAGVDGWMVEGARQMTQVVSYERNRKARERCIRAHGLDCSACGINFAERYGELGRDFIHVHHLREISSIGTEYVVDPVADLRPLCPNCHAMVHRRKPALTIEELRQLIR